jgi:hypothetical protein
MSAAPRPPRASHNTLVCCVLTFLMVCASSSTTRSQLTATSPRRLEWGLAASAARVEYVVRTTSCLDRKVGLVSRSGPW